MSKPRYGWWSYARYMIRIYPTREKEYEALHEQSVTANLSGVPVGNGASSRGTENVVLRQLPKTKQREYEAVKRAIESTSQMSNGKDRIRIIDLLYWKHSHTLGGAALAVGYGYDRARQIHGEFVRMVATYYGLMEE